MDNWSGYGYSTDELFVLNHFDASDIWSDEDEMLYIEAKRRDYYNEFYSYLRENGIDPFHF